MNGAYGWRGPVGAGVGLPLEHADHAAEVRACREGQHVLGWLPPDRRHRPPGIEIDDPLESVKIQQCRACEGHASADEEVVDMSKWPLNVPSGSESVRSANGSSSYFQMTGFTVVVT